MEDELYVVAWGLHNLGLSVIPSGGGENGKAPLVSWTEYQSKRPTDEEMHQWQDEYRPTLWGAVTGRQMVAFDCDKPEAAAMFEAAGLKPHVKTPRGGFHYYFRSPGFPVKTRAGILPGLDVRGAGGFVNIAGHNHAGGYQILKMPGPDSLYDWSHVPPTVLEALEGPQKAISHGEVTVIPEGQRNATLTSLAGTMRRRDMTEEAIVAALLEENAARCAPPLPEAEVRAIAASVVRYPPNTGNNVTIYGYREQTLQAQSPNNRYKNVTDSCCNGTPPDLVTVSGDPAAQENAYERVLAWVKETSGWWSTQELDSDLGFKDTQSKNYRRLIVHRLKEQGIIEPHPTVNKQFRHVDKRLTRLDFKRASSAGVLSLRWPFGIESHVNLYPGNLVVVAGSQNAGKTALLLNVIRLNMDQFPMVYFSSEMGDVELQQRLEMFPGIGLDDWRFDAYPRSRDFHDVVKPDLVNVIDFLEVSDEFWRVNAMLTAIAEKIGSGVAIVALQKKPGALLGRGDSFSLERPRLYLSMDKGKLTIVKGKSWANPKVDPNGLTVGFKITGGCQFEVIRDWGNV